MPRCSGRSATTCNTPKPRWSLVSNLHTAQDAPQRRLQRPRHEKVLCLRHLAVGSKGPISTSVALSGLLNQDSQHRPVWPSVQPGFNGIPVCRVTDIVSLVQKMFPIHHGGLISNRLDQCRLIVDRLPLEPGLRAPYPHPATWLSSRLYIVVDSQDLPGNYREPPFRDPAMGREVY